MNTQIINGKVQEIKNKSVKLNNTWFNSFIPLSAEIRVNDYVQIKYTENQKEGKTYHNIKSISKLSIEKEETKEVKLNLDTTTKNTILMISKDIFLSDKNNLNYDEVVKEVIKGLNNI